jgi:hypothetical protein
MGAQAWRLYTVSRYEAAGYESTLLPVVFAECVVSELAGWTMRIHRPPLVVFGLSCLRVCMLDWTAGLIRCGARHLIPHSSAKLLGVLLAQAASDITWIAFSRTKGAWPRSLTSWKPRVRFRHRFFQNTNAVARGRDDSRPIHSNDGGRRRFL